MTWKPSSARDGSQSKEMSDLHLGKLRWRSPDPMERTITIAPHQNLLAPTPYPDEDEEEVIPEAQGHEWKTDLIERWQRGDSPDRGYQG